MLPTWSNSPRQKPSISLPVPITALVPSSSALEAAREPLGQSRRADFLRRRIAIVGHAIESHPGSLQVRQRIARLVAPVPRLAGRADDGQPLTMGPDGNRRSGHRTKRHRVAIRTHVIELGLVHVAAKNVAGIARLHALFRL